MTTIEQTGAEEVAWDLSDLYASGDDPRIESRLRRGRGAPRPRSATATTARSRPSPPPSSPRRSTSASGSRRSRRAPSTTRTCASPRTWPTPPAARSSRSSARRPRASRRSSSSSASSGPRSTTSPADGAARRPGARPLAPLALGAARVPALPAHRAGGEDHHREGRLGRLRLVAALRGGARRASASTSRARRSPSRSRRRWRSSTRPTATCGAAPPRRSPPRSSPGSARARRSSTRSSSTSGSTTGCAGYPTWISSRNLANETTDDAVQALVDAADLALRRAAALLPAQGEAARARPARALRPLRARRRRLRRRRPGTRRAGSSSTPTATSRARPAPPSSGSSTTTGSTRRCGPDKRHGAYCATNVPGVHPYVFMNYTGDRRSILTLAHELGHALHGSLAQPLGLFNASTPLTTAETASVFGEALTFKRLLAAEDDPRKRLDLLTGPARGRDRDDVPPDRDEPLRERRPTPSGASRASCRPTGSASSGSSARRRCSATRSASSGYDTWWSYIPHFTNVPGLRLRVRLRLPLRARDLPLVPARGRRDRRPVPRPAAGRRLEGARGARADGRPRPHRSVDLGERDRGALRRPRRGRGARGRDRPRLRTAAWL